MATISVMFWHSYLFAFLFWSNFALGSSAILMIFQLTGGAWGEAIEVVLISATRTIYVVALLFIPIFFGLDKIYVWANPIKPLSPIHKNQDLYLNPIFYDVRTVFYFTTWMILSYFLVRWSEESKRDRSNSRAQTKITFLSGGGLVLYGFTVSFAAIDWVMSLEPKWYSTVYGLIYAAAQGISAFSLALVLLPKYTSQLSKEAAKKVLNDLGNILLAFIMFWAYVSILQYVIIWSGNIPVEALWFNHRSHGGWQYLALILALIQFTGPFLFLLFKDLKRNEKLLSLMGVSLLVVRIIDVYWFVMPAFHPDGIVLHGTNLLLDVFLFSGLGAIWLISFRWSLRKTHQNTNQLSKGAANV